MKLKLATKPNGKPAAPSTIRNTLTVLNASLKLALDEGRIKSAPRIRFPKVPVKEAHFFERDIYEQFVTAATDVDPQFAETSARNRREKRSEEGRSAGFRRRLDGPLHENDPRSP